MLIKVGAVLDYQTTVDAKTLMQNLVQGVLVNGSMGRVIGFETLDDAAEPSAHSDEYIDEQGSTSRLSQQQFSDGELQRIWPRVRFLNGQEKVCTPQEFTVNNPSGVMEARRLQVTL
jgi:hypothetical protein